LGAGHLQQVAADSLLNLRGLSLPQRQVCPDPSDRPLVRAAKGCGDGQRRTAMEQQECGRLSAFQWGMSPVRDFNLLSHVQQIALDRDDRNGRSRTVFALLAMLTVPLHRHQAQQGERHDPLPAERAAGLDGGGEYFRIDEP
jgi:hypothetical protein